MSLDEELAEIVKARHPQAPDGSQAAETLKRAAHLLEERQQTYGPPDVNFGRIATIASVMLGREVTKYEIAMVLLAVKLGRIPESPAYADSYDDGINYLAFAKQWAPR